MEISDLPDIEVSDVIQNKYTMDDQEDDDFDDNRIYDPNDDINNITQGELREEENAHHIGYHKRTVPSTTPIQKCADLVRDGVSDTDVLKVCLQEELETVSADGIVNNIQNDHLQGVLEILDSSYIPTQPTIKASGGDEFSILFKMYMECSQCEGIEYYYSNPVMYPIEYHYVKYPNETGSKKMFFSRVCDSMMMLFDYVNPQIPSPRMFISNAPDHEIVERFNLRLNTNYSIDDLPMLYMFAGSMCHHAVISGYSTGIPLSRMLTSLMVSKDAGIDKKHLKIISLIEHGGNRHDALDIYTFRNSPQKRTFLEMFLRGVYIRDVLADHMVTYQELFNMICSETISKEMYQKWWATNAIFPNTPMKSKFLDYLFNHDSEIIRYTRMISLDDQIDDNVYIQEFHKNMLLNITGGLSPSSHQTVSVINSNVSNIRLSAYHTRVEVNPEWFKGANPSEFIQIIININQKNGFQ